MLKAIAPWFGGKRSMAPDIVGELGEHKSYYEPFCGSCAVLFAKPICSLETVNDLHGDLINLAMVLASDRWRELYEAVDRMLLSDALLDALQETCATDWKPPTTPNDISDADVRRATEYTVVAWQSRNGASGTKRTNYQICVRWTSGGGSAGIRWRAAVDSVPGWHDRLKGVVILNRDAFQILESIEDQAGTAIYLDPPYMHSTRTNSEYVHDFAEHPADLFGAVDDHERLATIAKRFKRARVVVSYYADPRLDELYAGWTRREFTQAKMMAAQNKRGQNSITEAPEVLLINGPSYAN